MDTAQKIANQKATTWTNEMGQTGKSKTEKGETTFINQ